MDDRFYLAVYSPAHLPVLQSLIEETSLTAPKEILLPGYEACEVEGVSAIRKSRFEEVAAKLYVLKPQVDAALLAEADQQMGTALERHQAMAADDDRLYNVHVYVLVET